MQGGDVRQIKRAVLAEAENATLSQFAATQATLQTFGCSELLHVTLNKA